MEWCIFSEFCREVLYCSVFSNSRIGNFVQVLVDACHLVSSQASHRHPQLVPVRGKRLCSFQWAPSDHSRDFLCFWYRSFIFMELASIPAFLGASSMPSLASWSHHRTPGRWCVEGVRGLYKNDLHGSDLLLVTILSEFTTQCEESMSPWSSS